MLVSDARKALPWPLSVSSKCSKNDLYVCNLRRKYLKIYIFSKFYDTNTNLNTWLLSMKLHPSIIIFSIDLIRAPALLRTCCHHLLTLA